MNITNIKRAFTRNRNVKFAKTNFLTVTVFRLSDVTNSLKSFVTLSERFNFVHSFISFSSFNSLKSCRMANQAYLATREADTGKSPKLLPPSR